MFGIYLIIKKAFFTSSDTELILAGGYDGFYRGALKDVEKYNVQTGEGATLTLQPYKSFALDNPLRGKKPQLFSGKYNLYSFTKVLVNHRRIWGS